MITANMAKRKAEKNMYKDICRRIKWNVEIYSDCRVCINMNDHYVDINSVKQKLEKKGYKVDYNSEKEYLYVSWR